MSVPPRPKVLFVEDESSISGPFSKALAREGFEPVVAATAARALELAEQIEPDIVLLDLTLPDGDGRDVCRALRRRSSVPIVMLTARGTETDRIVGLELGADDYVVKPFSGAEVIARIRAVLRRTGATGAESAAAPPEPVTIGRLHVDPAARRVHLAGEEVQLSRKEFDLLVQLVAHAGRVVMREDLMARVGARTGSAPPRRLTCTSAGCARSSATVPRRPATCTPSAASASASPPRRSGRSADRWLPV
jgi:DNA-binding response OmpR family regulator